jgi:maltokinase
MSTLLALIAHGRAVGEVRFTDELPGALAFERRAGLRVRRNSTEQSNTSVVYGDRFILKLYRRLAVGLNPELEVHRRLRAVHDVRLGDSHLAVLHGAIETDIDAGPVTLGILHSFAPVAVDGWDLVTAAARAAIIGDPLGIQSSDVAGGDSSDIRPALRELGGIVAAMHGRLADAFGSAELTQASVTALKTELRTRLAEAGQGTPILRDYLRPLGELVDSAVAQPNERAQRIHGDLHLGQALRTPSGWLLIDFEGEPAAPIDQRTLWRSPLQDVAGVLRSLEYAAGHVLLTYPPPSQTGPVDPASQELDRQRAAQTWVAGARESFWQGYAEVTGAGPIESSGLLSAYEADKAVYEVIYETRNRPGWVPIPMRAVKRLADSRMRTVAPVGADATKSGRSSAIALPRKASTS